MESDIMRLAPETRKRIPTGIPGLDGMIEGGLQTGDFVLLSGGVGAGKTTFCCQYVNNAVRQLNEPAVFATFEEDIKSLRSNILRYGINFSDLEKQGKLKLLDLEVLEGSGMGANIESLLSAVDEIQAKRLVVDSLTAFLSGAREKFDYNFMMHLVYKTLKREGITTMMTISKNLAQPEVPYGVEEFIADGIFQIENYVTENMELKTRFIVRKLRGTDHSRKYHTVAFTQNGIEIIPFSP